MEQQTILGVFAHPDDEILGPGGAMAHYAARGVPVELICATRGEAGEISDPALATPETLPAVREAELQCSADTLGIQRVTFLDYRDSGMAGAPENDHPEAFINVPAAHVVAQLVALIRRIQPAVILTFEPFGGYGHPDHIAIHHHTLATFDAAADPTYRPELGSAWQTTRLFYPILPLSMLREMTRRIQALGLDVAEFIRRLDERQEMTWPESRIHVVMDVSHTAALKWRALHCHRTQFGPNNVFRHLPEAEMQALISREYFALARPDPPPGLHLTHLLDQLETETETEQN